jgi:hypothetical protein
MRSICKKGSATLVAVLALCVVASASASAAEWHVGGKSLSGSAKLATAVKTTENITITVPALKVKIVCTGAGLSESKSAESWILAPNTLEMYLHLKGCKLSEPTTCTISEEIVTRALVGTLTTVSGSSSEDKLVLSPLTHKVFFEALEFKGTCAESGEDQIGNGTLTLLAPSGQTEAAEQTVTSAGKESGLNLLGYPLYISGGLKLKLASGSNWSFH